MVMLPRQEKNYTVTSVGSQLSPKKVTLDTNSPKETKQYSSDFETYELEISEFKHVVQGGETLSAIAAKYGISLSTLYEDNKKTIGENPNVIHPGQELVIRTGKGLEKSVSVPEEKEGDSSSARQMPETIPASSHLEGYTGEVHIKGKASDSCKNRAGTITTDNQKYQIVSDSEYTKQPGTISESDYHLMIAQVAGEASNSKDDMLAVASTVLNRLEAGGGYGDSVRGVLEKGYFPWARSYLAYVEGGKYYQTDWGQEKLKQVTQAVNDALAGARNIDSNVYYYSGDGTHNYFSDVL